VPLSPIIWPLRAVAGKDLKALQAAFPVPRASGFLQPILMRQRPRPANGLLAPAQPVNLPWNAIGLPTLVDLPVRYPRPIHQLLPYPPTYFKIRGTTKDSTGAALGTCVVDWFDTITDVKIDTVTSDANGLYEFRTAGQPPTSYYLVAYKAGAPDVAGTTVNTLMGSGTTFDGTLVDTTMVLQLLAASAASYGDGNPIDTWPDTGAFGVNSATQTGGARPDYVANVLGTGKKGVSFNGSLYAVLPNTSSLNITGDITLLSWIYVTTDAVGIVIGGYDAIAPYNGYGLSQSLNTVGKVCGSSNAVLRDGNTTFVAGWQHWALSITGGVGTFYLNGAADGTGALASPASYAGLRAIGADAAGGNKLTAYLRDVRIYNRALTGAEVAAIYTANLE
jgi:hypothetical protein